MKAHLIGSNFLQSPEKCFLNLDFLNSPNKNVDPAGVASAEYSVFGGNMSDGCFDFGCSAGGDCADAQTCESAVFAPLEGPVRPFNYTVFAESKSQVSVCPQRSVRR